MTAAAQTLYVAQPSLSQHVQNLESELGSRLLVRGAGGVRATDAGELLYRHAKMVLRQMDEAKSAVLHGVDTPSGHVTIGLPTSTSRILAIPLIATVAERYPDVVLEIIEASSADLAMSVYLHRMDMAITMDVQSQPVRMTTLPLFMEELYLVGHPLKAAVTLRQMSELPLILPSFPNSIRALIMRIFAEDMLPMNVIAETSAVSVLLSLAESGKAWTVLPASALAGLDRHNTNLVRTPIAAPGFSRRVSLCMSSTNEKSNVCLHIRQAIIDTARSLIKRGLWTGVVWEADKFEG